MLNTLVKEYYELTLKEEELKTRKNELKAQILEEMQNKNLKKFLSDENIESTIQDKKNFTYTDETAMINYLKEHGYTNFIKTEIAKTTLNADLKKPKSILSESLKAWYTETTSQALKVEKK